MISELEKIEKFKSDLAKKNNESKTINELDEEKHFKKGTEKIHLWHWIICGCGLRFENDKELNYHINLWKTLLKGGA